MDINRIIDIIRSLKEDAPTMNLGAGQIAGTVEAGDNPPVFKKKKKYIYGKGFRKNWLQKRRPPQ